MIQFLKGLYGNENELFIKIIKKKYFFNKMWVPFFYEYVCLVGLNFVSKFFS